MIEILITNDDQKTKDKNLIDRLNERVGRNNNSFVADILLLGGYTSSVIVPKQVEFQGNKWYMTIDKCSTVDSLSPGTNLSSMLLIGNATIEEGIKFLKSMTGNNNIQRIFKYNNIWYYITA